MDPQYVAWSVIGLFALTMGILTLREDALRRSGK
jgi:hypothetical protein